MYLGEGERWGEAKEGKKSRGVARILGKGVLDYTCKILSHAHLLTGKVEVQIITENAF